MMLMILMEYRMIPPPNFNAFDLLLHTGNAAGMWVTVTEQARRKRNQDPVQCT